MNNTFRMCQWGLGALLCRTTMLLWVGGVCLLPNLWFWCFVPTYRQVSLLIIEHIIDNQSAHFFFLCYSTAYSQSYFCFLGFYFSPSSVTGCLPCLCHTAGSVNQVCDKLTGQCICQDISVTGRTCERCKEHHFGFDSFTGRWVCVFCGLIKASSMFLSQ